MGGGYRYLLLSTAFCVLAAAAGASHGAAAPPPGAGAVAVEAWPGQDTVVTGDKRKQLEENLSGLFYEPAHDGAPTVLWAIVNGPSTADRLIFQDNVWTFDTANNWGKGKALRYRDNTGDPDAEDLTRAELDTPFFYVATEKNNDSGSVSRLSVLRFDSSAPGTTLTATHEWNLTPDLPKVDPNLGLEAITWIPDSYLVSKGFLDESHGVAYNPAQYPNHGTGLFVVGLEANGTLYAYALNHADGTFHKIATVPSGQPHVMGLDFDRDTGALWSACDDTCDGNQSVLGLVGGKFVVRRLFAVPKDLQDLNNEGITLAPERECAGGLKKIFWSDDSRSKGHALRIGSIPCGSLF
ncbi:MAG TPA: hypothetical protein VHU81_15460 [Thermoanaerobaculia bacterium]|jgi:hypothetical protein|nr:hypothetical protein [Thermoanaerobaculia bacterium]